MSVRATRQLLDAIQGFRDAYQTDKAFAGVLKMLDDAEEQAEKLVPAAVSSGDPDDQPKTLPAAAVKARQMLKQQRKDKEYPTTN